MAQPKTRITTNRSQSPHTSATRHNNMADASFELTKVKTTTDTLKDVTSKDDIAALQ